MKTAHEFAKSRVSLPTLLGMDDTGVRPFLKWAGGKQRLLPRLVQHVPPKDAFDRYLEPFLGSGAVFFSLAPKVAVLGDLNEELINAFVAVRDDVRGVLRVARSWVWDSETYYGVRSLKVMDLSSRQRAARFIYLNRTGWNGLYRVNQKGEYNVPMGTSKTNGRWLDEVSLLAASKVLRGKELLACNFEVICEQAQPGDFVYLDPPYHGDESFTKYTTFGFTHSDHERLADVASELRDRGSWVLITNSNKPYIRQLYEERGFVIHESWASRSFSSNPGRRGRRAEIIATSWHVPG